MAANFLEYNYFSKGRIIIIKELLKSVCGDTVLLIEGRATAKHCWNSILLKFCPVVIHPFVWCKMYLWKGNIREGSFYLHSRLPTIYIYWYIYLLIIYIFILFIYYIFYILFIYIFTDLLIIIYLYVYLYFFIFIFIFYFYIFFIYLFLFIFIF